MSSINMNKIIEFKDVYKTVINKKILKKGTINGLAAFLISYFVIVLASIVVNLTLVRHLSKIIQGSIGNQLNFSITNIVKVNNILMNFSVFNSIGDIKLGLLLIAIIPIVAFFIANRRDNIKKSFGIENAIKMVVASLIYATILWVLSYITRGEFVGFAVNFANIRNYFNTIIITLLIQLVIASSYHKDAHDVIVAARITVRGLTIIGILLSILYMTSMLKNIGVSLLIKIGVSIGLLFNIASYEMFKSLGVAIRVSDDLDKLLQSANFDFNASPVLIKVVFVLIFIVLIGYSIYRFEENRFIRSTIWYCLLISGFLSGLAYYTTMNFGIVSFVGDVRFGVSVVNTFFITFFYIMIVAIFVYLLKRIIKIYKG